MAFRIAVLFICSFVAVHGADVEVQRPPELTFLPAGVANMGDTVTITCTSPSYGALDMLVLAKTSSKDGNKHENEVVKNSDLQANFKDTGRYTHTSDFGPSENTIVLTITGITGEDGGDYECKHIPMDTILKTLVAAETLLVDVPPKSVQVMYTAEDGTMMTATNGDTVQLFEDREVELQCQVVVEGSDKAPQIDITVGDKVVTSMFNKNENPTSEYDAGLWKKRYQVDFEYTSTEHDLTFNGKILTCNATNPKFDSVSSHIRLEIMFKPRMVCKKTVYYEVGHANANLTCKGTMFPKPLAAVWQWGILPNRTVLQLEEESIDGVFRNTMQNLEQDEYQFTLSIDEVNKAHFQEYQLTTSNSVGETDYKIVVEEAAVPTPEPDVKPGPDDNGDASKNNVVIDTNMGGAAGLTHTILVTVVTVFLSLLATRS